MKVPMYCGVCRERDLLRGGRGRGDLIGWATVDPSKEDPAILLNFVHLTGRDQLHRPSRIGAPINAPGGGKGPGDPARDIGRAGTGRYHADPPWRPLMPGDNLLTAESPRTRRDCRRGHQLSVSMATILGDVARGQSEIVLRNVGAS